MGRLRLLLCAAACLSFLATNAKGYDGDWAIEPIEIIVQGVDDAIVFRYNVPALYEGKECSVRLFEEDCITEGGSSVYTDIVDTSSVERQLTSNFRIDTITIKSSSYYTEIDPYRGRISFCTRVDCTLNGESLNFHETKLLADFDWTVGFAIFAELLTSYSRYKQLYAYSLSLYTTDGDLGDDSLAVIQIAAELFLEAELNAWFQDLNNTVDVTATVLDQTMITKEDEIGLRYLRARDESRSLAVYYTGTELEVSLEALFDLDPAPHIDEVNAAQAYAWIEHADLFLANLTAILSICGSELVDISEADLEYAKSLYTNTTLLNSTLAAGLANLTYEELVFTEAVVAACGNITEMANITELLVPQRLDGSIASVSFGVPINAFFCDARNDQVPDPVISQGDTIQICVRLSQNSSYFHLEDIYMVGLTQPTTGVPTHYAVSNGDASGLATKNCQLSVCNILSQVPSRFFGQDAGPVRIVGVALLNFGLDGRRVLAPIEFSGHRQLQAADVSRSAFELVVEIVGQGGAPTNSSGANSDIGIAGIILLIIMLILPFVLCIVIWRRRKTIITLVWGKKHNIEIV